MTIAVIGHGHVGGALAVGLNAAGHDVVIATATPDSESVQALLARDGGLRVAAPTAAVASAEAVILATPFQALQDVVASVGPVLGGKVLVDCTNPVGPGLRHGLGSARAGAEAVQEALPSARVVKAFSVYGYENFEGSRERAAVVRPMMPICGNEATSKTLVASLATDLGWDPLDVGGLEQALHLEHMTLLWVRMVRMAGGSPRLVWAALRD
jgi:predicted dinucleotide-binding enzyme